jgi:hypothetical protein
MSKSDKCPECGTPWTREQSTFFRNLEFVHCIPCEANEETILKRVEADPSLIGKKKRVEKTKSVAGDPWGMSGYYNDYED